MAEKRIFYQPIDFAGVVRALAEIDLRSTFKIGGTAVTATAAQINASVVPSGSLGVGDRAVKTAVFALSGATIHAGVTAAIQFSAAAVIQRVFADITTVATGACTLDIGYTAVSATTGSDTLLDGIDVNGAVALFDSMDATLDSGANAHAQKAASGKWITVQEKTGDATGLVGNLYIQYILI